MLERLILTEFSTDRMSGLLKNLDTKGWIQQTENYCYLKVDDAYIHAIHPLLAEYGQIEKPDYFSAVNPIGAHISVIYPEDEITPRSENIAQIHTFSLSKLIKVQLGIMEYYALSVISPSLTSLRKAHELPAKLSFKGQEIGFHITVGVRKLSTILPCGLKDR